MKNTNITSCALGIIEIHDRESAGEKGNEGDVDRKPQWRG